MADTVARDFVIDLRHIKAMEIPSSITASRLWQKVCSIDEYVSMIKAMRIIAGAIANKVEALIPDFTDHSLRHMDALWSVADQVITEDEMRALTTSEALLLAGAFYVHDLGMALAATEEGLRHIRSTSPYLVAHQRLTCAFKLAHERADLLAVRLASRELHAEKALDLVIQKLPGLGQFLIEDTGFRSQWAYQIGRISQSHHWDLDKVHRELGSNGASPSPTGDLIDLAYVACLLRITDYAHINRERASNLERALRSEVSAESAVHWDAQSNITGPIRKSNELLYGCTAPIEDVDAWWLFYDLASGLDSEIRNVRDYLSGRSTSFGRFSLQGVKGVESPQSFTQQVQLAGTIYPLDIRVQPHSMERVVELLGGSHIYGADQLAPIRELIQNAYDAIRLRETNDQALGRPAQPFRISVNLVEQDENHYLSISDNGNGMTRNIVTKHLIGVGSDYWHSAEFFRDFGLAVDQGFAPIGKFGIGFLSVFMIGDLVEVETEALNASRVRLRLRGLGRRGELSELKATGQIGTTIRLRLKSGQARSIGNLAEVVRARAPMLTVPIEVHQDNGNGGKTTVTIEPGWWKDVEESTFVSFLRSWRRIAFSGTNAKASDWEERRHSFLAHTGGTEPISWPESKPEARNQTERVLSFGTRNPPGVLRCSLGMAIDVCTYFDMAGIAEIGYADLTVSRHEIASNAVPTRSPRRSLASVSGDDVDMVRDRLRTAIAPSILDRLNGLDTYGMLPARLDFLRQIGDLYGHELLNQCNLHWIPTLEPPGNFIHRSRKEVLETLRTEQRVIVASGVGMVSAYTEAATRLPEKDLSRTFILPLRYEEIKIGYSEKEKLKYEFGDKIEGTFNDVLAKIPEDDVRLNLLPFLLAIVEEAWHITERQWQSQNWTLNLGNDTFWSVLTRPEAHGLEVR